MSTTSKENIHSNGKTRPVRDAKGHFVGSVSVKKAKTDLMTAISEHKPVKKSPVKRGISKSELVKTDAKPVLKTGATQSFMNAVVGELIKTYPVSVPNPTTGRLTIYRVYNPAAGQGSGYYFTIKPSSPNETLEPVMTLYNPKTDLIALERAIKKYCAER